MKIHNAKLKIPWPFFEVNVFIIESKGEYALIDTGLNYHDNFNVLCEFVSKVCGFERIKFIFLTHGHPDHYGNIKEIFQKINSKIPIILHPKDKERVIDLPKEVRREGAIFAYEYLTKNGVPEEKLEIIKQQTKSYFTSKYRIDENDISFREEINIGDSTFKVFHTPGHTPGHVILYSEKDAIAFVGDHIFSKGFPVPLLFFTKKEERFQNLPSWIESLKILEELDLNIAYPGHLEPISSIKSIISKMKERVEKMKKKTYEIISQRPMTIYEIGQNLYPQVPDEFWSFKFSEAQGYVDLLEKEKIIKSLEENKTIYYEKI